MNKIIYLSKNIYLPNKHALFIFNDTKSFYNLERFAKSVKNKTLQWKLYNKKCFNEFYIKCNLASNIFISKKIQLLLAKGRYSFIIEHLKYNSSLCEEAKQILLTNKGLK